MLGVIRVAMLAVGFAALVAAMVMWIVADAAGHEWIASLLAFSLIFAFALLAAAIAAILLMPTSELPRPIRRREDATLPTIPALLLVTLAAAAVLQLPLIRSWWAQDQRLLVEALGTRSDPLALNMIPAAIVYSIPSLAIAMLVTCILASLLGILTRADLVVHALMSCAAMQAGLVAGVHLLLWEFRETGTALLMLFADARDQPTTTRVAGWFAAHDAIARPASWRLVWILGGSVAAVAISELLEPRRPPEPLPGAADEPAASSSDAAPEAPRRQFVPVSSASSAFDYSNYCVKPRRTFLQSMFLRWYPEYDIQTIPPMSRARFSFSWKTGIIRREPGGPDLVTLQPSERHGLLGARSYVVTDAVSGASLCRIVPNWSEWEILDPLGDVTGRVEEETGSAGFASYVAIVNEEMVCRFTWGMLGYLWHNSELEVEFLRGTHTRVDRAIMIALAPILEHQARMARAYPRQST